MVTEREAKKNPKKNDYWERVCNCEQSFYRLRSWIVLHNARTVGLGWQPRRLSDRGPFGPDPTWEQAVSGVMNMTRERRREHDYGAGLACRAGRHRPGNPCRQIVNSARDGARAAAASDPEFGLNPTPIRTHPCA